MTIDRDPRRLELVHRQEPGGQPRLRVSRLFGRTSVWAGFSMQAQTPSAPRTCRGSSISIFGELDALRNERISQVVAAVERALAAASASASSTSRLESAAGAAPRVRRRGGGAAARLHPPDVPPDASRTRRRSIPREHRQRPCHRRRVPRAPRHRASTLGGIRAVVISRPDNPVGFRPPPCVQRDGERAALGTMACGGNLAAGFRLSNDANPQGILVQPSQEPGWQLRTRPLREPDTRLRPRNQLRLHRRLSAVDSERLTGYSRVDVRPGTCWSRVTGRLLRARSSTSLTTTTLQRTDSSLPGEPPSETRSNTTRSCG